MISASCVRRASERKHSREGLLPCAGSIDISRLSSLLLVRFSLLVVYCSYILSYCTFWSIQSCKCFLSAFLFNFLVGFGISVHIFLRIPTQRYNIWLCLQIYIFLRPLWGPCGSNKLVTTMRHWGIVTHVVLWLQVVQIRIYFVCTVPVSSLCWSSKKCPHGNLFILLFIFVCYFK